MKSAQHEGSRRAWEPMTLNQVGDVASVILSGGGSKPGTKMDTDTGVTQPKK